MSTKIESKSTWQLYTRPPSYMMKEQLERFMNSFSNYPTGIKVENLCTNECIVTMQIDDLGVCVIRIAPNPDHFQL